MQDWKANLRLGWRLLPGMVLLLWTAGCVSSMPAVGTPNVVILFADDLGYGDLGSYGHPYARTPNLDRLASEGQRWTDFYVAAPVCSPSRGALLTGKLPTRTGLYGRQLAVMFPNDSNGIPAQELTLAEALQQEGYATAIIGKWHLGDAPAMLPTRHGFDYWYGIPYSNDMDWVNEPGFEELMAMSLAGRGQDVQEAVNGRLLKYFDPKVEYWNVPIMRSRNMDGVYQDEIIERPAAQKQVTRRYTEEAIAFMRRSKERPFLLYVPYNMPHTPLFRSDAFAGKSLGGRYGDVIEELDWSVGAIVEELDTLGLSDNTLVIFTSDNGPWLYMRSHGGSAGLLNNGKATTYEGGMRVPAIFWSPGRVVPKVVSDIGSAMDIYATVLSLANVEAPADIDGVDLTLTLTAGEPSPREAIAYYRAGELRALRKGQFKLSLISEGAYGLPPQRTVHERPLLYDLAADPSERFDVADQHPEVVADLLREIGRLKTSFEPKPPIFDRRLERFTRK